MLISAGLSRKYYHSSKFLPAQTCKCPFHRYDEAEAQHLIIYDGKIEARFTDELFQIINPLAGKSNAEA